MAQVTFIQSAADNLAAIRELLRAHESKEPIRIAIAFWGTGAEGMIANEPHSFEIICNLTSGGTNPKVIRQLNSMDNVAIVQLNTLHAKVVIADGGSLVSSANASTNGLALEGTTASTWQEAGVVVPRDATSRSQIISWFNELWAQSLPIKESDLVNAELLWSQRKCQLKETKVPAIESDDIGVALTTFWTFAFKGRAPMIQVYIRSAAALVALGGCNGAVMPVAPFKFLFSGTKPRAFEEHEDKFEVNDGGVRLKEEYIGYFVGEDGRISTCPSRGRFKSLTDGLVNEVAAWMICGGALPDEITGEPFDAGFLVR